MNRKYFKKALHLFFPLAVLMFVLQSCGHKEMSTSNGLTPNEGMIALLEGNQRFISDRMIRQEHNSERMKALKAGQHPFAVVVCCSDSRVTPELIFDQGLGDLFVIRNAGNIIGDYELGGIEYAVEHLGSPLVVVLGHTSCGAIGAYIEHKHDSIPNHIQKIVDYIKMEPEEAALNEKDINHYQAAVEANILHGVHTLEKSEPVLANMVAKNKVKIVGALFNLETGKIIIIDQ